jgi:murein tripeptide amidase MpaA
MVEPQLGELATLDHFDVKGIPSVDAEGLHNGFLGTEAPREMLNRVNLRLAVRDFSWVEQGLP